MNGVSIRDKFIGSWKLIIYETRTSKGQTYEENDYIGQLIYSKDGHMSVQMVKPNRPKFPDDLEERSNEDVITAFEGYGGYFGTYTINEEKGIITHHLMGAHVPNWEGMDFERFYRFIGDKLELTSRPFRSEDIEIYQYILWERFT